MTYRTSARSLYGCIMSTAFAVTMMAMSFATTFTADPWPPGPIQISLNVEQHVYDVLAAFDHISVAPMRHVEDVVAPERKAAIDVLFASQSQPGQDWRISVDAYRHIDPGRRMI